MKQATLSDIERLLDSKLDPIKQLLFEIKEDISAINKQLESIKTRLDKICQ